MFVPWCMAYAVWVCCEILNKTVGMNLEWLMNRNLISTLQIPYLQAVAVMSVYLSYLFVFFPSDCLSIYLSICLSVCLSVCLSIYLSIYLSILYA